MEEVKSSVYLAKKNPWNSSWPFLKYNKEAGLLTMGRAALECWDLSWEGEEAPQGTHKAGLAFLDRIFPGFGNALGQAHCVPICPWLGCPRGSSQRKAALGLSLEGGIQFHVHGKGSGRSQREAENLGKGAG